jgi:hypothetical protein
MFLLGPAVEVTEAKITTELRFERLECSGGETLKRSISLPAKPAAA